MSFGRRHVAQIRLFWTAIPAVHSLFKTLWYHHVSNTRIKQFSPDASLSSTMISTADACLCPMQRARQTIQPRPPHAPRIRRANCISFCMMVTRFAWIAHRFESSKRCTRNASAASCSACMACDCHLVTSDPGGATLRQTSRTCSDC